MYPWHPIIEPSKAGAYQHKLAEIANLLLAEDLADEDIGLLSGKTGVANFLFYYGHSTGEAIYTSKATALIHDVFNTINIGEYRHTYCNGIAGVGWAMEHWSKEGFLDVHTESVLSGLPAYAFENSIADLGEGNYDFLHGALGSSFYLLHRSAQDESEKFIDSFLDHLKDKGIRISDNQMVWESVLNLKLGNEGYNLSLSHGVSSINSFLVQVIQKGMGSKKALPLLDQSINFLLAQECDAQEFGCYFPNWIEPGKSMKGSRVAWCYGDLGVGVSLYYSAIAKNDAELEKKAISILLDCASKRGIDETGAVDAGLCHGAAGNAHIFNRLYHVTKNQKFKSAALYWFEQVMELAKFDDGLAGFKVKHEHDWVNSFNLLEGVAGVGLALLAATTYTEPKWDQCLLLS